MDRDMETAVPVNKSEIRNRKSEMRIGIDLGTTNTKALALNDAGEVVYECSHPTVVSQVPTGGEMDAKQLGVDLLHLLQHVVSEARHLSDEPITFISIEKIPILSTPNIQRKKQHI